MLAPMPWLYIIYDSIQNTVFAGQVLSPLIKKKTANPQVSITIISFERAQPPEELIASIQAYGIELIIVKRYPFLLVRQLNYHVRTVQEIIQKKYGTASYNMLARGPHAGFIALSSIEKTTNCSRLVIQVRGLVADELAYCLQKEAPSSWWRIVVRRWQIRRLATLETLVYGKKYATTPLSVVLEVVSIPLKNYLMRTYRIPSERIREAHEDIPVKITEAKKQEWRSHMRSKLGIPQGMHVFCYNGSAKPWQCPEHVVAFFKKQLSIHNDTVFLLVITQDKQLFLSLLKDAGISPTYYYVCTVSHEEIYRYLAIADTGLLFREKNIINWVSRPTKAVEYEALDLPIVHDNNVGHLVRSHVHTGIEMEYINR